MLKKLLPAALALSPMLLAATSVRTNFEGGSAAKIERISDTHFRIEVNGETDQAARNRQASWYYFRVEGAPSTEILFDMVGLPGEYNFQPNQGAISGKTPPVISYDRKTWKHLTTVEYDPKEPRLRLRIQPEKSAFWIAHTPPYTQENLAALRRDVLRHKQGREEIAGKTVEGRDLYLWTFGPVSAAKTVWLMFRQHSWESGSSWVGEGLVRSLMAERSENITWRIFPMCDPDGVARGGVRFNRNGYGLNRNWDVNDPKLMPEITAQRQAIAQYLRSGKKIDLFLSLHNTETAEYLEAPPTSDAGVQSLAKSFFASLNQSTYFSPSRPLFHASTTTTEGMKGRMNVIQGLFRDYQIPGFLMEQRIGLHPKLSRFPEVPDRLRFGQDLVRAITETLR